MIIRETTAADLDDMLHVERVAFGQDDEAELVREMLDDESAQPLLSLLAFRDQRAVGHILFSAVRLTGAPNRASILAPLAVVPDCQRQGIGARLIETGLQLLTESGVELVFVLGSPDYYPRHGFQPAGRVGFDAPHPVPDEHADAWMVQALRPGVIGTAKGTVICADTLSRPEYW
jgi:putative acetyltransferase